jgi:hypothetical protein
MADVAKADISAVQAASRAGRLYVPTRSLPPESFAVPRPFAPAPTSRCDALHEAYGAALSASIKAARGLDVLAAQGTPSRALALARAAASVQSNRRGTQARQDGDSPESRSPARRPVRPYNASARGCGPVEQAIRDCGVSDPVTLLRAAAIDKAARRLITQAGKRTPAANSPDGPPGGRRAAASAAQIAAQSFPQSPAMGSATGQPSRSAPQATGSDTRTPRQARQLSLTQENAACLPACGGLPHHHAHPCSLTSTCQVERCFVSWLHGRGGSGWVPASWLACGGAPTWHS